MGTVGKQRLPDANYTNGLGSEVVEFCRLLARVLARVPHAPRHQVEGRTQESEDHRGVVTGDLQKGGGSGENIS